MPSIDLVIRPVRGTREDARFPLILLALLTLICVATVWSPPAGRTSWALEVGPGLAGVAVLIAVYPRFPMTRLVYAFVFVHVKFFGSGFLFNYLLLGLMFPAATAILPLFIKIRDLGLLDTYWGVVLPQVAFGLAASILLFRNYFRQLPGDLFDAALIDGCGYFGFFRHIVLPLSIALAVAVMGLLAWLGFRIEPQDESARAQPTCRAQFFGASYMHRARRCTASASCGARDIGFRSWKGAPISTRWQSTPSAPSAPVVNKPGRRPRQRARHAARELRRRTREQLDGAPRRDPSPLVASPDDADTATQ